MTLYPVGTRVLYRHWESDPWKAGTVVRYWAGVSGNEFVDIKRDGYRETSVLPVDKLADPVLVRRSESVRVLSECVCPRPCEACAADMAMPWWARHAELHSETTETETEGN